jgi:type I restriction enzyme S subunit
MLERPSKLACYRFDQLADQITQRVMPAEADVERYVGLEHLDPDSLCIRRWGDPSEVESTKLRFEPGDIIFGKRRVYQRKVAVADTEGICSAHAMVLRPKPDTVLSEFLPFFMQSDLFMERALGISVGSLSPTINWKALAKEKFLLPPIQEQARLVEAFHAADAQVQAYTYLIEKLSWVREGVISSFLDNCGDDVEFGSVIVDTAYGTSKKSNSEGKGTPVLGIPNVLRDHLSLDEYNSVELTDKELKKLALNDGDLLVVRTNGNPLYVGRSVLVEGLTETFAYASYLIRVRVNRTKIIPEFAACVFGSERNRRGVRQMTRSSAGNYNLNSKDIKGLKFPIPDCDAQSELVSRVLILDNQKSELEKRLLGAQGIKNKLIADAVQ